jgi:hypothetical protein
MLLLPALDMLELAYHVLTCNQYSDITSCIWKITKSLEVKLESQSGAKSHP